MDANIINPFLQATLEIIRDVAQLSYQIQKIYKKNDEKGQGDITGIIGLSVSGKGTVAVTFDQSTILYIVSKILDMELGSIDEEIVIDTVGELANMITGRAVRLLAEKGYDLDLTVPTVVHGADHKVVHQTNGPKIAIPYSSEQGNFTVEFSFDADMKPDMSLPAAKKTKTPKKTAKHPSGNGTPPSESKEKSPDSVNGSEEKPSAEKDSSDWGMPQEEVANPEAAQNKSPTNWGQPETD